MELTTFKFNSPVRVTAIISRSCKAPFHENRLIATTKNIKKPSNFSVSKSSTNQLIPPVGLHGESMRSRFSRSSTYGQLKPNSIKASSQVESTAGSDPILTEIQDESDVGPDRLLWRVTRFGFACYKFMRPVGMIHVITLTTSLFARVVVENPYLFRWSLPFKAFPGLVAIMLANAYNIGLNQIFDADIDRVNKPYLPIAAGDLSLKQAWFLVIFYILSGLLIFRLMNADLVTTALYSLGLLLATVYSAPPFRFKGSSVATSIVLTLMGVVETVGILYATRTFLGLPFWWSPSIVFVTAFATSHYLATSIMKDLTDVEGDMKNNIRTFTAIYGPRAIAFVGTGILFINIIGATAAALYMPQAFKRHVIVPFHLISALWLLYQVRNLDGANYAKEESTNFYVSVWKLNILGLLLFPFM